MSGGVYFEPNQKSNTIKKPNLSMLYLYKIQLHDILTNYRWYESIISSIMFFVIQFIFILAFYPYIIVNFPFIYSLEEILRNWLLFLWTTEISLISLRALKHYKTTNLRPYYLNLPYGPFIFITAFSLAWIVFMTLTVIVGGLFLIVVFPTTSNYFLSFLILLLITGCISLMLNILIFSFSLKYGGIIPSLCTLGVYIDVILCSDFFFSLQNIENADDALFVALISNFSPLFHPLFLWHFSFSNNNLLLDFQAMISLLILSCMIFFFFPISLFFGIKNYHEARQNPSIVSSIEL